MEQSESFATFATNSFSSKVTAVRIVIENLRKRTAEVDGRNCSTSDLKSHAIFNLGAMVIIYLGLEVFIIIYNEV